MRIWRVVEIPGILKTSKKVRFAPKISEQEKSDTNEAGDVIKLKEISIDPRKERGIDVNLIPRKETSNSHSGNERNEDVGASSQVRYEGSIQELEGLGDIEKEVIAI